MKLQPYDKVNRKFIESYPVKNREVLTHTGYKPIKMIHKTIIYEIYEITLENGMKLKCADDHIVMTEDIQQVFAKDSLGKTLYTINGPSKVISVVNTGKSDNMYDIEVDSEDHLYFSDGILSHNTLVARIFILWCILFGKDIQYGITANKQAQAKEVLDGLKLAYMSLPLWMQSGVKKWNEWSIYLENGGVVKISATSSSAFRGMSFASTYEFTTKDDKFMRISSGIYADEVAFVPRNKWEEFKNSVIPTVSSGPHGRIIYTSTPFGMNHFHKIWKEAKSGYSGFKSKFVPYWEHPERDEVWAEKKKKELGSDVAFQQEFGCSFEGSSFTLIDGKHLSKLTPIEVDNRKDLFDIKVYEEPKENHLYIVGVDTAKYGDGDFLSMQVLDITSKPFKQVASFRKKDMTYLNLVKPLYELASYYNEAHIFIENNSGDGQSVADLLYEQYEYENIYAEKHEVYGFRTTPKSRRLGLQNLKQLVEDDMLIINDKETIEELLRFSLKNGKYQATDGYNDDAVMALVATLYFLQLKNWVDSEDLYNFFNNSESTNEDDEPFLFGFMDDGSGGTTMF